MISIRFVAQDLLTKQSTTSTPLYFPEINEAVEQLISLNRQKIQKAMPSARVFAVIQNEEGMNDHLFT